jgi:hypothetical protein
MWQQANKEYYQERHRRVQLGTPIASGKRRTNLQDPQEDPGTGIREASRRDIQRVTTKQTLDTVEGHTPSETEEETALA